MSNLLSFCLLFARPTSDFVPALLEKCCWTEGGICLRLPGVVLHTPSPCLSHQWHLSSGQRKRHKERSLPLWKWKGSMEEMTSYTWLALPIPLGVSLSSPWHRTPSQFILDLSIPDHFSISSFCIHSFFTFLTPKLDPSVSDSFLGPCPPSTQRQSCGFALRISL